MNLRTILVSLFVASLLSFPVFASQPAGLAANLITDLGDAGLPSPLGGCFDYLNFEWNEWVGPRDLEPGDRLRLELAIAPFRSGSTVVTLDEANSETFFSIEFLDGFVSGMPYRRSDWNDVVVEIRPATEDYLITVNGVQGGPFSYDEICTNPGGCYSVGNMRISGHSNDAGSAAWVDSIVITRGAAGGDEALREITFDQCGPRPPYVRGGVLLIADPPKPLFHRGRSDSR